MSDQHDVEATALTAIINRIIASKGDINCLWMNLNHIPIALKYYDALAVYTEYIRDGAQ